MWSLAQNNLTCSTPWKLLWKSYLCFSPSHEKKVITKVFPSLLYCLTCQADNNVTHSTPSELRNQRFLDQEKNCFSSFYSATTTNEKENKTRVLDCWSNFLETEPNDIYRVKNYLGILNLYGTFTLGHGWWECKMVWPLWKSLAVPEKVTHRVTI